MNAADLARLRELESKATPLVQITGAWGLIWQRVTRGREPASRR